MEGVTTSPPTCQLILPSLLGDPAHIKLRSADLTINWGDAVEFGDKGTWTFLISLLRSALGNAHTVNQSMPANQLVNQLMPIFILLLFNESKINHLTCASAQNCQLWGLLSTPDNIKTAL